MGRPAGHQLSKAVERARAIEALGGETEALYAAWRRFARALSKAKRRLPEEDYAAIIVALSARTGISMDTLARCADD